MSEREWKTLRLSVDEHVGLIQLCRPQRLNAYDSAQYYEVADALEQVAMDKRVHVAVITASGSYFSSGHDISESSLMMSEFAASGLELDAFVRQNNEKKVKRLIRCFIDFPKPLIGGVNGHCIGVAVTTISLCDVVYAAESAPFSTPFMQFAFCAEGCSSVVFPELLGMSKANELLLLGEKLSAREAERSNFVAKVFADDVFHQEVMARASKMASYPPQALIDTKSLVQNSERRAALHRVNNREMDMLAKRQVSEECMNAMTSFMAGRQDKRSGKHSSPKSKL